MIDTLCDAGQTVVPHFLWRPLLRDANDEMVLEAAINGHADGLVTFNHWHFACVAKRFGAELLAPGDVLRRMQS